MRRLVVVVLVTLSGCIAASARLHVGPTVTSDGKVDMQAGIAVGFGYALSDERAVTGALGVSAGSRNPLELTDVIEYVELPDDRLGKRAGLTARIPLIGDQVGTYLHVGAMYPLRYRSSSGGHEKSFQSRSTSVLAVGAQGRFGLMSSAPETGQEDLHFAAGGDVTLDWWLLSRWR